MHYENTKKAPLKLTVFSIPLRDSISCYYTTYMYTKLIPSSVYNPGFVKKSI